MNSPDTTKTIIPGLISQVISSIYNLIYYSFSTDKGTTHYFIICRITEELYKPRVKMRSVYTVAWPFWSAWLRQAAKEASFNYYTRSKAMGHGPKHTRDGAGCPMQSCHAHMSSIDACNFWARTCTRSQGHSATSILRGPAEH